MVSRRLGRKLDENLPPSARTPKTEIQHDNDPKPTTKETKKKRKKLFHNRVAMTVSRLQFCIKSMEEPKV